MTLTNPQITALQQMLRNRFTYDGCAPVRRVILNQLVRKKLAEDTERVFEYKLSYASGKSVKIPVGQITLFGVNVLGHMLDLLGCTVDFAKQWIEAKFQPGMTWNNWSRTGWHVDHLRPIDSFDLTDLAQQKQCFHYTNLHPLWAGDNLSKGAKWADPSLGEPSPVS